MITNEWFEEQDLRNDIQMSAEYIRRVKEFITDEGSNRADAEYFVMEEMLEEQAV